jgi:TetR/AcrR family transcriptional regulator
VAKEAAVVRSTVYRYLNTVELLLLGPPWTQRPPEAKRTFVEEYVLPGLVRGS